jgi:hypothetical protein
VISGHIHPALTLTRDQQLLAAFVTSGQGGKELLLCRSTDGGLTWAPPVAITGPPGTCSARFQFSFSLSGMAPSSCG